MNDLKFKDLAYPAADYDEAARQRHTHINKAILDQITQLPIDGRDGNDGAPGEQGPPGPVGPQGPDGRKIELNVSGTILQWRYSGETTWKNLFSIPQPALVFSPHLWPVGTEINFGDGSYGIRLKGNIVAASNVGDVQYSANLDATNLIDCNGWWQNGASNFKYSVFSNIYSMTTPPVVSAWVLLGLDYTGRRVSFVTYSTSARSGTTNNAYDIWFRYTKT